MEANITPDRIANAIIMDSRFLGSYLIVEGKKDTKTYGKFIDNSAVRMREAFGFEKVIQVLEILKARGYHRRLGIIDSDFTDITKDKKTIDNLFYTDDHDAEMMIIKTEVLENVLELLVGREKLEEYLILKRKDLRELIFAACMEISYLKLANKKHDLGLVFKPKDPDAPQLKYKNFINETNLNFMGRNTLVDTVINYSRAKSDHIKDRAVIEARLDEVSKIEYDVYSLINGHDASNIIFILIKKVLKCRNPIIIDYNSIEDCLAIGYDMIAFSSSKLFDSILQWSETNKIRIFRGPLPRLAA